MTTVDPPASVVLPPGAQAPSLARAFLRSVRCCGAPGRLDSALLLVSELVTNAVRHGAPPLHLQVDCDASGGLRVRVTDGSDRAPVARPAGDLDESGRGIELVDVISDDWGVEPSPDGKTVWFRLR